MAGSGTITRKDLITDEAIKWGDDYNKEVQKAIDKNKEFLASIKGYSEVLKSIKDVKTNEQFKEAKQREIKVLNQASIVWKEQTQLENQLVSAMRKRELATSDTNKKLIEERAITQQINKEIKQQVLERINQTSAYKKLSDALGKVRTDAKNVKAEMFQLEQQGKANTKEYERLRLKSVALTRQTNILDKGVKDIDSSLGLHQRNVGNYGSALSNISPIFSRVNSQLGMMGLSLESINGKDGFKQLTSGIVGLGKATLAFLISPIGIAITVLGGLFALIRGNKDTVIEFNSGLLDVGKTTGITGDALSRLGTDIIKLSRDLKTVGTPLLLEYATVAGQLGVKGSENITKFASALAKLETASDISGGDGASSIARLLTLTDGGVENIEDFGDEIVRLGNNFAATENEILGNATAIAQNTGVYKVGRQEVLAYAVATKAVGVEAELTGSTIGRTLGLMEKSIRTGKNIDTVARLTNQSVEDLKTSFKEDASGVLFSFVQGLNAIDNAGGSVNEQLEKIGITSVRDQRVIASLATGGFDTLAQSMSDVKNASGAMSEEFETAQGKLENQYKRVGIAWDNLVLSFENGEGIIASLSTFFAGTLASALELVIKYVDELSLAWNVFGSYLDDFFPKSQKAGESISLLTTLSNIATIAVRNLAKLFFVDIPNAFDKSISAFVGLQFGFTTFKNFIFETAPLIKDYILDMLNPLATADATKLNETFDKFKDKLIKGSKDISDATEKRAKDRIDDFAKRYADAQTSLDEGALEAEKKKLEAELKKIGDELSDEQKKKHEEYLKRLKKLADSEYELYQFRKKNAIELNKDIIDSDKNTLDERLNAFVENASLESELIRSAAEKRLKDLSRYDSSIRDLTDNEIKDLLDGKEIKTELNDDEILAVEQFFASSLANRTRYNEDKQKLIDNEINIQKKSVENAIVSSTTTENEDINAESNQYLQDLENFKGTEEQKIALKEAYEQRILDIQREALREQVKMRIDALESILESNEFSVEKEKQLQLELSELKSKLLKTDIEEKEESLDKSFELEKEQKEKLKELLEGIADAAINLTNAIFDARIQKIDEEIEANNLKYESWLENENLTEEERKAIEEKRAKEEAELEKKKRKEQIKQAIFNKALAVADVGINTARAIVAALAMGPPQGFVFAALAGALGVIQTAAVLATPIPKYEKGTEDHKGGHAMVGEKRPEVILEPNKEPYVISKPSILDLPKHTKVVPSLNEFEKMQRASMLASLDIEANKLNTYNPTVSFDDRYSAEILDELKKMNKKKTNVVVNSPKQDINYDLWKMNNYRWQ